MGFLPGNRSTGRVRFRRGESDRNRALLQHERAWFESEHRVIAARPNNRSGDETRREAATVQDEWKVHEGAIDQHEFWEAERDSRIFRCDFNGDDSHDYDQTVGGVEVVPLGGKMKKRSPRFANRRRIPREHERPRRRKATA